MSFAAIDNMSALEEKMQRILLDNRGYNRVGTGQLFRYPGEQGLTSLEKLEIAKCLSRTLLTFGNF